MQTEKDFEKDEKLALIVQEFPVIKSEVLGIEVNSKETQTKAAGYIVKLKGFIKEIEKRRKAWVTPFNDVLALANRIARERKEPIKKLLDIIEPSYLAYQKELDDIAEKKELARLKDKAAADKIIANLNAKALAAKTDKAQEKIQEKIEIAENAPIAAPVKVENTVKTDNGSVSFRESWTHELLDMSLIPREYLKVDEPAIRQAVRDGVREIKGVRIYLKKTLSGRT